MDCRRKGTRSKTQRLRHPGLGPCSRSEDQGQVLRRELLMTLHDVKRGGQFPCKLVDKFIFPDAWRSLEPETQRRGAIISERVPQCIDPPSRPAHPQFGFSTDKALRSGVKRPR